MSDKAHEAREALTQGIADGVPMEKLQMLYAQYVLHLNGGNRVHTSAALEIDRRSIQRWIKSGKIRDVKKPAPDAVAAAQ